MLNEIDKLSLLQKENVKPNVPSIKSNLVLKSNKEEAIQTLFDQQRKLWFELQKRNERRVRAAKQIPTDRKNNIDCCFFDTELETLINFNYFK